MWGDRQPCLVHDFNGAALSFSPSNLMLAIGLLDVAFLVFSYALCIPDLSKAFNMKGSWIFLKFFFSIQGDYYEIFACLSLFIWWI